MSVPSEDREEADPFREPSGDLGAQLELFRPRLARMVAVRIDPRLRRRVDPDDVLQEAFVEVARRMAEYEAKRRMPFFLWVRLVTGEKLLEFHRRHLAAAGRDVGREITPGSIPSANSSSLAERFVDPEPSPSGRAARHETLARVREALEGLEGLDREVLALRYFEGLTIEEAATVLGLSSSSAKRRHLHALRALRVELPHQDDVPTPP